MPPQRHVLLFRGINVGGHKIVKMDALRRLLADAGFTDVATYIQSGNVVLTAEQDEQATAAIVEAAFPDAFGFTSCPTVRSLERWRRLVEENPFAAPAAEDGRRVHAIVLDESPRAEAVEALRALASSERIEIRDDVLYLHTPDGFGTSEVAKALDRVLKVPLTARNWNTVLKLLDLAENAGA